MIYTASYSDCKTKEYPLVSIDPRLISLSNLGFYSALMPRLEELNKWRKKSDNEVLKEFYFNFLRELDLEKTRKDLENCIIIGKEQFYESSIRHVLASYLELQFNIEVPEVQVKNDKIEKLYRPDYIKEDLKKLIYQTEGILYE